MKNNKKAINFPEVLLSVFLSVVVGIIITSIINYEFPELLAGIGIQSAKIQVINESRKNGNFEKSIKLCKQMTKNKEKAPYAYVAMGEMYAFEMENHSYKTAYDCFNKAIINCSDFNIFNSCMLFIIQQSKLVKDNRNDINIFYSENIGFVTDVLNGLVLTNSSISDILTTKYPFSKKDAQELFFGDGLIIVETNWKYVSTLTTDNPDLSFINKKEKLVFIDSWQELISPYCATTKTYYKYYRYKGIPKETLITIDDILKNLNKSVKTEIH